MKEKIKFLKSLIRDVPDFPKKGIVFKDITPLLLNPGGLKTAIELIAEKWKNAGVTKIASIESRGFIFGAAIAIQLNSGFVPLRKKGKLPWKTRSITYDLEYGTDTIEVHEDSFSANDTVVIVDDLLATGGSALAASKLISRSKCKIAGASFLIELGFLKGRDKLKELPEIHTLIVF